VIQPPKPIKLTFPSLIMGLTICIGLGITVGGAVSLAELRVHPAALAWMVIACMATLFGCTAMIVRFWLKVLSLNRETYQQYQLPNVVSAPLPQVAPPPQRFLQNPPRPPSVTEHTTRTFSPVYRDELDREKS
jgi:hypothetical protein